MSLFAEQLKVALEAADVTQAELGKRTGISQSTISRYLSGEIDPEPDALGSLLDELPVTLHTDLISARILDEIPKEYRNAVQVFPRDGVVNEDKPPYIAPQMASDLRNAIEYLAAESVRVPEIRDAVIALAAALGAEPKQNTQPTTLDTILAEDLQRRSDRKSQRKNAASSSSKSSSA